MLSRPVSNTFYRIIASHSFNPMSKRAYRTDFNLHIVIGRIKCVMIIKSDGMYHVSDSNGIADITVFVFGALTKMDRCSNNLTGELTISQDNEGGKCTIAQMSNSSAKRTQRVPVINYSSNGNESHVLCVCVI